MPISLQPPTPTQTNRVLSVNMDAPDSPSGHDTSLDMDVMHDFGEGVGVDMRDFENGLDVEGDIEPGVIEDLENGDIVVKIGSSRSFALCFSNMMLMRADPQLAASQQTPNGISSSNISIAVNDTPVQYTQPTPTSQYTHPTQHSQHSQHTQQSLTHPHTHQQTTPIPMEPPSSVGLDDVDDMFQTETGLDGDEDDDDGDGTWTCALSKLADQSSLLSFRLPPLYHVCVYPTIRSQMAMRRLELSGQDTTTSLADSHTSIKMASQVDGRSE